jgi:GNAT superfamily N-acetyltransferase
MLDNVPQGLRVQEPTDQQLLAAVRLGSAMWDDSAPYASLPRAVDKMIEFAYHMRADPLSFFGVAVDGADTCHGFVIGSLADYGFADARFAYDRLLYVAPTMRGSVAARMLIGAFETWARDNGAQRVLLGVTTGVHTERTEQFYNKLGYATVGRLTMKET